MSDTALAVPCLTFLSDVQAHQLLRDSPSESFGLISARNGDEFAVLQ